MSETHKINDSRSDKEDAVPTASSAEGTLIPGGQVGKYKILSILGEGGFGIIYLAEQKKPVRRLVALKNKYDPTNLFRLNQNIKPTV